MAMEVLAAEFPEIFNQYIEIVPEVSEDIQEPTVTVVGEVAEDTRVGSVSSKTVQNIFLEHDYGQKAFVQKDANKNFSKTDFENTVFSSEEESKEELPQTQTHTEAEYQFLPESRAREQYDELDNIIEDLRLLDGESNSNSRILFSLEEEKSSLGCNWTSEYSACDHGPSCPFTSKFLDLGKFPSMLPAAPSLVVLRNTPAGLVKVPVSLGHQNLLRLRPPSQEYNMAAVRYLSSSQDSTLRDMMSSSQNSRLTDMMSSSQDSAIRDVVSSNEDTRLSDITNQMVPSSQDSRLSVITNQKMTSYRPPANSIVIKVPGPPGGMSQCPECDSAFSDNKSLVKHTRNHHQLYQCSKCGENMVGYYRVASHSKKNHSKEPSLFCPCGRTFSEKRGLARHQNSCVQIKNA